MTVQSLLSQLRERGIQLKISGPDRLIVDAPKGALTPELRNELSLQKAEILKTLQEEELRTEDRTDALRDVAASAPATSDQYPRFNSAADADDKKTAKAHDLEEIGKLEEELSALRTEIEARRAEAMTRRSAAENAMRLEQDRQRLADEEAARQRAYQERVQIEIEERERAEEEHRQRIADQDLARLEEELARRRSTEQHRRAEVEARLAAYIEARRAEMETRRLAEEERERLRVVEELQRFEAEAHERVVEDETLRRFETQLRAIEEELGRIHARDEARRKAAEDAARKADDQARARAEEEARRKAQEDALRKAEEEARLRARIEAEVRAEAELRRKTEEETRRRAEEESRRRAEEEARQRAEEEMRCLAEEEAHRLAQEERRRQAEEEEARRRAEEDAQRRAEEEKLRRAQAEAEARLHAEAEARERRAEEFRQRAELEARIRAEIEAKIRAEEEAEDRLREPGDFRPKKDHDAGSNTEIDNGLAFDSTAAEEHSSNQLKSVVAPGDEKMNASALHEIEGRFLDFPHEDLNGRFQAVSVPESRTAIEAISSDAMPAFPDRDEKPGADPDDNGNDEAFGQIMKSFDDPAIEARNAAARALSDLPADRAAAFTRALREASPQRRQNIGAAMASSGLADEAIENLTGENREATYDAFSLLFLMSKTGEVQPLMRAIEEHPSMDVRLAVVKLLALCGQPSVLPAFRRMAVRGSLPPEIRSAVMEAIYQMTSQPPAQTIHAI